MFKSIYLVKRNPALSAEEFPARWRQHSSLARTTKRIRPYLTQVVQCARADLGVPADATEDYDGANLLGLASRAGGYGVFEEPEHRDIMLPDELLTFSRPIRESNVIAEQDIIHDGPRQHLIVLRFLKRDAGLGAADFVVNWREVQSSLDATDLVSRSVQNAVVEEPPPDCDFDLVTETWFASEAQLKAYFDDAQRVQSLAAGRKRLCRDASTVTFVAKVNLALPPLEQMI